MFKKKTEVEYYVNKWLVEALLKIKHLLFNESIQYLKMKYDRFNYDQGVSSHHQPLCTFKMHLSCSTSSIIHTF